MNIIDKVRTLFYYEKKVIIVILLILISIGIFVFSINGKESVEVVLDEVSVEPLEEVNKEKDNYVYVDVKGEVSNPGVYKMKDTDRVIDVLNKATLKKTSNTKFLNLSKILTDQMVIYIYSNNEIKKIIETEQKVCDVISNNVCISKVENLNSVYLEASNDEIYTNLKEDIKDESSKEENILVNINTCSKEDLMTLPGIGESKANNIISYRNEKGQFNSIEDILNVSGIGESIFEKIKKFIQV